MPHLKYRAAKEVYKTVKHGPTVGRVQYLGRYVAANVRKNYANPVVRRSK